MKINKENFSYIADLAKLTFLKEEKEQVIKDLNKMIEFVEMMNIVDTDKLEAMTYVNPIKNVLREDYIVNDDLLEGLLANAPESVDGCFVAPQTIEMDSDGGKYERNNSNASHGSGR